MTCFNYLHMCCSSHDGYHPIQLRLADYNGTQCGYCTPGFVMSMYRYVIVKHNSTVIMSAIVCCRIIPTLHSSKWRIILTATFVVVQVQWFLVQ